MTKKAFFYIFLLMIIGFVQVYQKPLLGSSWQLWTTALSKSSINKNVKVEFSHQCRFNDTLPTLDYFESSQDLFFRIKGSNYFGLGISSFFYKEDYARWVREFDFSAFIKNKIKIFGLGLSSNLGVEYRSMEDSDSRAYVKFQLGVDLLKLKDVTIYAKNKFYYNYNNLKQYDRNRTTIGVSRKFFEHFEMAAYYIFQKSKSRLGAFWGTANIVGLDFMFDF